MQFISLNSPKLLLMTVKLDIRHQTKIVEKYFSFLHYCKKTKVYYFSGITFKHGNKMKEKKSDNDTKDLAPNLWNFIQPFYKLKISHVAFHVFLLKNIRDYKASIFPDFFGRYYHSSKTSQNVFRIHIVCMYFSVFPLTRNIKHLHVISDFQKLLIILDTNFWLNVIQGILPSFFL